MSPPSPPPSEPTGTTDLERALLRREALHSLKNSMNLLASLLGLQQLRVNDRQALLVLRQSIARVQALALMYDKRFTSDDLSTLHFGQYLRETAPLLAQRDAGSSPALLVEADDLALPLETASPYVLLVQELLSGVLGDALPAPASTETHLRLRCSQGRATLSIAAENRALVPGAGRAPSEVALALAAQVGGSMLAQPNGFAVEFLPPLLPPDKTIA